MTTSSGNGPHPNALAVLSNLAPQTGLGRDIYQSRGKGRIAPGSRILSPHELAFRTDWLHTSGLLVTEPKTIGVLGPKGESTKTTTAMGIAHGINASYGGGVFFLDENPQGNAEERFGWKQDWPNHADFVALINEKGEELTRTHIENFCMQTDHGVFGVGRADKPLSPEDYLLIRTTVLKFFKFFIVDGENAINTPAMEAVRRTADVLLLLIPTNQDAHNLWRDAASKLAESERTKTLGVVVDKTGRGAGAIRATRAIVDEYGFPSAVIPHIPAIRRGEAALWGNIPYGGQESYIHVAAATLDLSMGIRREAASKEKTSKAKAVSRGRGPLPAELVGPTPPAASRRQGRGKDEPPATQPDTDPGAQLGEPSPPASAGGLPSRRKPLPTRRRSSGVPVPGAAPVEEASTPVPGFDNPGPEATEPQQPPVPDDGPMEMPVLARNGQAQPSVESSNESILPESLAAAGSPEAPAASEQQELQKAPDEDRSSESDASPAIQVEAEEGDTLGLICERILQERLERAPSMEEVESLRQRVASHPANSDVLGDDPDQIFEESGLRLTVPVGA